MNRKAELLAEYFAAMDAAKAARAELEALMETEGADKFIANGMTIAFRNASTFEAFDFKAFRESAPQTFAKYCARHVEQKTRKGGYQITRRAM